MSRLLLFISAMTLFSCLERGESDFHKLTIELDKGANFYIHKVTVESEVQPTKVFIPAFIGSTENNNYQFDSLPAGRVKFTIQSLFGRTLTRTLTIDRDEVVRLNREQFDNFETDRTGEVFNQPLSLYDTFRLVMQSSGCAGRSYERTEIIRTSKGFLVNQWDDQTSWNEQPLMQKQFDSSFSIAIDSLQQQWKRRMQGFRGSSTLQNEFYICVRDKVFSTVYTGGKEMNWSVYYNFTQHFDSRAKAALKHNKEHNAFLKSKGIIL